MRVHFMSDLHLEEQDAPERIPGGDLLVIAGDLTQASLFLASTHDTAAQRQLGRLMRFHDRVAERFAHVVLVPGNHEHIEGVVEESAGLLRHGLPGFVVLDDEEVTIGGHRLFGTTLWADFDGGDRGVMEIARKRCGEFYFARRKPREGEGRDPVRLTPADTLALHRRARERLESFLSRLTPAERAEAIVVTHHAPSARGLNPLDAGNGLEAACATPLDALIEAKGPGLWVHGHTHIRRKYAIGATQLRVNCRGLKRRDPAFDRFDPDVWVEPGAAAAPRRTPKAA